MYKILADGDVAVVIDTSKAQSPQSFVPENGLSAYDIAERHVATRTRVQLAHDAVALTASGKETNYVDVWRPIAYTTALAAHAALKQLLRHVAAALEAADDELAVYNRTTPHTD